MLYEKNRALIQLVTSTGLLLVTENIFLLFYDRYSGFTLTTNSTTENNECRFLNNLHQHISKIEKADIYHFFYYYPLLKSQISLSKLFREFIKELSITPDFEEHCFKPFLWKIGKIYLGLPKIQFNEDELILEEMRRIHGPTFTPTD